MKGDHRSFSVGNVAKRQWHPFYQSSRFKNLPQRSPGVDSGSLDATGGAALIIVPIVCMFIAVLSAIWLVHFLTCYIVVQVRANETSSICTKQRGRAQPGVRYTDAENPVLQKHFA